MVNWIAGAWTCRKSHLITLSAGAGTNYQVGIKVYKTTGTDGTETVNGVTMGKVYVGSSCRDDFGDIRFTDNDGSTVLDYWQDPDLLVSTTSSVFWVEVKDTLESDATIYVYYNNAAQTTTSNFTNTMLTPAANPTFTLHGSWETSTYNIQTTPGNTKVADNNYGYMTTNDLWTAQNEGCDWVWDLGTTATRTFVRWKANATRYGAYALSFVITLQSSTNNSAWDTKETYTFTETGSKAVATTAMGTGYRYFKVDQWSSSLVLVIDGQTHVDSVYASKYVSPEPAHSTWGGSELTPKSLTETLKKTSTVLGRFGKSLSCVLGLSNNASTDYIHIPGTVTKTLSDALAMVNIITNKVSKSLVQTLALSDIQTRVSTFLREFTDGLGLSDVFSYIQSMNVSLIETLALADIQTRVWEFYRAFTSILGTSDTISRTASYFRSFQSSLGLSSTIFKRTAKSFIETLTFTDIQTRVAELYGTFVSTLGMIDSVSREASYLRSLTSTLGLNDISSQISSYLRDFIEVLGFTEIQTRVWGFFSALSSTLGITDVFSNVSSYLKNFTENLGLGDLFSYTSSINFTLIQTLALSDVQTRILNFSREFISALGMIDTISEVGSYLINLTSTLELSDLFSSSSSILKIFTELLGLIEIPSILTSILRILTLGMNETISRIMSYSKNLIEILSFLDTISNGYLTLVTLIEDHSFPFLRESIMKTSEKTFVETKGWNEILTKKVGKALSSIMEIVSSVTSKFPLLIIELFEMATLSEVISFTRLTILSLTSTLSVLGSVSKDITKTIFSAFSLADISVIQSFIERLEVINQINVISVLSPWVEKLLSEILELETVFAQGTTLNMNETILFSSNLLGVFRSLVIKEILSLIITLQKDFSIMRNQSISLLDHVSIPILNLFELLGILHSSSKKILKVTEENSSILWSLTLIQKKNLVQSISILTSLSKKVSKVLSAIFTITDNVTNSNVFLSILSEILHLTSLITMSLTIRKTFTEIMSLVPLYTNPSRTIRTLLETMILTHDSTSPFLLGYIYARLAITQGYYEVKILLKDFITSLKVREGINRLKQTIRVGR